MISYRIVSKFMMRLLNMAIVINQADMISTSFFLQLILFHIFDSSSLHIFTLLHRWACRNCMVGSGNMRPCDFKMGKLLASLRTFKCMYNFEIRYYFYCDMDPHLQIVVQCECIVILHNIFVFLLQLEIENCISVPKRFFYLA